MPCAFFFQARQRPKSALKASDVEGTIPVSKEGHTAPYSGLRRGFFALLLHERPFFQSKQLLLIAMLHRRLDWQDGVQVVAISFHPLFVDVGRVLHRDELPVHQLCDVLHHGSHRKMHSFRDGAVTGMALMRASVFAVKQIGVDRDGSVTDVHEKQFIGQREKVLAGILEHGNPVFIDQSAMVQLIELFHSHVHTHVQLGCNLIRAWYSKNFCDEYGDSRDRQE